MSWHDYSKGQQVMLDHIEATCEKYIKAQVKQKKGQAAFSGTNQNQGTRARVFIL